MLCSHDDVVAVEWNCRVGTAAASESGRVIETGSVSKGILVVAWHNTGDVSCSWDVTTPTVWTKGVSGLCPDEGGWACVGWAAVVWACNGASAKVWTCDKF